MEGEQLQRTKEADRLPQSMKGEISGEEKGGGIKYPVLNGEAR